MAKIQDLQEELDTAYERIDKLENTLAAINLLTDENSDADELSDFEDEE